MRSIRSRLALLFVSLGVAVLLLEFSFRLYLAKVASEESFRRYASLEQIRSRFPPQSARFSPHRYLGHYPTPNHRKGKNRHNALGFRGAEVVTPKPANEFRIVCLGGSTTYTSAVEDYREAYPQQLERALREKGLAPVTVVNGGASDWTTLESLINLETRVLDLEPDLVIVYHAINDLHARIVWPPDVYRGDNSGARGVRVSRVDAPDLSEHSALLRFFLVRFGMARPHGSLESVTLPPPSYHGNRFARQTCDGRYPSGIFTEIPVERMLAANPPRYYRRNLEAIAALAAHHGIEVVFATMACRRTKGPALFGSNVDAEGVKEMNAVLSAVAGETEARLFDFASVFGSDPAHYTDGVHVTATGARRKGELFASFLIESGLFPSR